MAEPKTVPDFLAADVADMEANPVTQHTEEPVSPETEQAEQVPTEQQAPPAPDIDAIDGEDRGQFIRKAALYEERQRRKEATERSRQWEQRYTEDMRKAQERLEALFRNAQTTMGQTPSQQPQKPAIPDINEDPLGHLTARNEELQKQIQEQAEWRKQVESQTKQQSEVQRVSYDVTQKEQEFAARVPDYWNAHQHLVNQWAAEAKAIGIPDQDIPEAIRARSIETVQLAYRLNRNPAEVAYERAKVMGYRAETTQAAPQAPAQPQQPSKLDTIAKGMATAKSPSATSGAPAAGIPTIEALLSMPEEEFMAKYGSSDNKTWDREMKRIMGIS